MIRYMYVLVGDLVASREAEARHRLTEQIETALASVNGKYARDWLAELETTRGIDEISGVLRRADNAFEVVVDLNTAVWPQRFRFGFAAGMIDVVGHSRKASDMDGPAFHQAADALARAKARHQVMNLNLPQQAAETCRLLEETVRLHHTLMQGWKPKTARAVQVYRELPKERRRQAEVAGVLGLSQQAVSEAHRRAHLGKLLAVEKAVADWLAQLPPTSSPW